MKIRIVISIALMIALLQGCIVKSLHPFYFQHDVIFKKELLNTWVDQDGGKWKINKSKEHPSAYEMHWMGEGDKDVIFLLHLFQIGDNLYLDLLPYSTNTDNLSLFDLHMVASHSIAKLILINKDEAQIKWYNEKWMRTLFDQNRIRIPHETIVEQDSEENQYILTASTEELQKFILKYGDDDEAFDDNETVWLLLKRSI